MQTIGERLEDARKRKGISIREAAEATKIRGDYLQRFEGNQFDLGLAEIYVKGFLRSYAHFLGLPADRIVNDFNALGHSSGTPGRVRTPSREVYGRMDLSVATTGESSPQDSSTPAASEAQAGPARRSPVAFSRGGGSLHQTSGMNPALVLKVVIGVAGLVVLVLIIWGIKSLMGDSRSKTTTPVSTVQLAPEQTISLIAVNPVSVQVSVKNPDGTAGEILFPNTPLARGEQRMIPWHSALYITATLGENVQIEVNKKRYPLGFTGYNRVALDAPASP